MNLKRQLILNFEHRVALTGDDFLVSDSNREAVEWIDIWPNWPAPALVIIGPPGSGKTHLAAVFAIKSNARLVSLDELETIAANLSQDVIVEDMAGGLSAEHEESFLHLYNVVKEAGHRMLITSRLAPGRWPMALPDLRSRLHAALTVEIGPPADTLISALLVKMFVDRQVHVSDDAIGYAVSRMERSFLAIRKLVATTDQLALREQKRITIALIKRALQIIEQEDTN